MGRFRSAISAVLLAGACSTPPAPPAALSVVVEKTTLTADGTDTARITATVPDARPGIVVRFTASAGLLSQSAAVPVDGVAEVVLTADREEDLQRKSEKPVTIRAIVEWSDIDTETATADVVFKAPAAGAPILFVAADPPALVADGVGTVTLTATGRRLPAGGALTWTTTLGTLSSATSVIEVDELGEARSTVTLTAPATPGQAIITATESGSLITAQIAVSFVEDGAPQFDLTGTFAQYSPARVKLTAGTLRPSPQCVLAPAILKVEMVQQGSELDVKFTTCMVTMPPATTIAGEVTIETPPAFLASLPPVDAHVTLSGVELGTMFEPAESVVVAGAELDDPRHDALPTDEGDARVRDGDGDGEPGMTVISSIGGEQHIVFRNFGTTRGVIQSSNRIFGGELGDLVARTESSVFGVGASFNPASASLPSVVEIVRVDGLNGAPNVDTDGDGAFSCQELIDAAGSIFTLEDPATPMNCGGI